MLELLKLIAPIFGCLILVAVVCVIWDLALTGVGKVIGAIYEHYINK